MGLLALLHAQQAFEPQLPLGDAIDTSYAHSWVVSLDGEETVADAAAGGEQAQVVSSACDASKPGSVEQTLPPVGSNG
eukprot:COSAG02_NODE_8198_length_2665_cov_1.514419_3_plen_77_part_01